jgi:hypothetical protein
MKMDLSFEKREPKTPRLFVNRLATEELPDRGTAKSVPGMK